MLPNIPFSYYKLFKTKNELKTLGSIIFFIVINRLLECKFKICSLLYTNSRQGCSGKSFESYSFLSQHSQHIINMHWTIRNQTFSIVPNNRNPKNDSPKQLEVVGGKIKEISVQVAQSVSSFCWKMSRK